MDVLRRLLRKRVEEGEIDTYMINGAKSVSYLVYANDVLIFSKANTKSLKAIKETLSIFSSFSGLEVNENRCDAFFSKSVEGITH